jgi:hypothetical protein
LLCGEAIGRLEVPKLVPVRVIEVPYALAVLLEDTKKLVWL